MKKLTFNILSKLKIKKSEEAKVNRESGEITVDHAGIVITGKPENITIFMAEMLKMTQNG